ncbi:MAG: hypothetical protein A2270_04365 [Elusimicrobia bacterium RIFOXYA12_FULL_51_18]|nr:MAG: hypothetical protein A2270_04365 [Elusimicrobia bacterium RIFOXYA12_FULL_51_18]OGS30050.1 MAG: hypothetical protein A2218_12960 [Elusimicrobia bacterium RIFOXYA2_FULL_53_38]
MDNMSVDDLKKVAGDFSYGPAQRFQPYFCRKENIALDLRPLLMDILKRDRGGDGVTAHDMGHCRRG